MTEFTDRRIPAIFLSHGAPPLADDQTWTAELADWSGSLPRPTAVLVVSAHWEEDPLTLGATTTVPLYYDFWGFPRRYYEVTYPAPGAPALAAEVRRLLADAGYRSQDDPERGLDHGAYVPLKEMFRTRMCRSSRSPCRRSTHMPCIASANVSHHSAIKVC